MNDWQHISEKEWYRKGVGTVEVRDGDWYGSNSTTAGKFCLPVVGPFRSARTAGLALELAMSAYLGNSESPKV